jgi:hypothetical protein
MMRVNVAPASLAPRKCLHTKKARKFHSTRLRNVPVIKDLADWDAFMWNKIKQVAGWGPRIRL